MILLSVQSSNFSLSTLERSAAVARSSVNSEQEQNVAKLLLTRLHLEKLGADRDLAIVFQVELRGSTKFMEEFYAAGFADYLDIIRQTIEEG